MPREKLPEVTPGMLKAGLTTLVNFNTTMGKGKDNSELIRRIYRAMELARTTAATRSFNRKIVATGSVIPVEPTPEPVKARKPYTRKAPVAPAPVMAVSTPPTTSGFRRGRPSTKNSMVPAG